MKIKELAQEIEICTAKDNLSGIAGIMQEHDSDAVPFGGTDGKVIGVITRDAVCAAIAHFDRKPSAIKSDVLALEDILLCGPQDKFEKVLKQLVKKRIKYAGISSQNGETVAIISLPKILSRLTDDKKLIKKVLRAMEKINKPLPLVLLEVGFVPQDK